MEAPSLVQPLLRTDHQALVVPPQLPPTTEPFWGVRLVDGSEVIVRADYITLPAAKGGKGAMTAIPFSDVIGARVSAEPATEVIIAEVFEPVKKAPKKPRSTDHVIRKLRLHRVGRHAMRRREAKDTLLAGAMASAVQCTNIEPAPRSAGPAQVVTVSRPEAQRLVDLVRLMALGSATRVRRVRVVLNPHSGKRIVSPSGILDAHVTRGRMRFHTSLRLLALSYFE
jgi:hypothetical protein